MLISERTKKLKEKEEIKSMSNDIGLTLIAYFAVMLGWSFVYLKIAAALGFNFKETFNFVTDPMGENIMQAIVSILMILIPTLVFCRIKLKKAANVVLLSRPKGRLFPIFVAGLGFCFFASNATEIAGNFFEGIGVSISSPEIKEPDGIFGFLMSVIVTALLPALIEEFSIRGIIMGILRKFGDGFAIICSAVVFGLMHASAEQIPFAALVGLVLGFIAVKTGSIWLAVGVHAANNLMCVLLSYTETIFGDDVYFKTEFAVNIILLLLFVWGVCNISRHDDEFFTLSSSDIKLKESKKLLAFFTAPAFICAAVLSLLIAFFLR